MRLLVIGASGRLGSHVVRTALEQGHAVTAASRSPEALGLSHPELDLAHLDIRDAARLRAILPGHQAVLSTLGYRRHGESPDVLEIGMRHLTATMPAADVRRLVALASAGILQWDEGHLRCERPGYPSAFLPGASMHRRAWQALEASTLDWTLVCPPELVAGDPEQPLRAMPEALPHGPLRVSMPALARWMVTAAVQSTWLRQRVGILDAPAGDIESARL